jgi:hypothetical protein
MTTRDVSSAKTGSKSAPLGAGGEQHFRGPAHTAGSVGDFSLYLNQGRNPYGN